MNTDRLLAMLSSAEAPLSGEIISRELGVSRTAVWKYIEALRMQGYVIDSAPRRGYRLSSIPDVIRKTELAQRIEGCRIGSELICLPTVDSTSNECKRHFCSGAEDGLVIIADEQSLGRGKSGKEFFSPMQGGLYMSVLLRPDISPSEAFGITSGTADAVCNAIEKVFSIRPEISPSSDIMANGKKMGGILTEIELEAETASVQFIIIGIGIYCNQNPENIPSQPGICSTSLKAELGHIVRRADLAAALIKELDEMYRKYPQ